MRVISHLFYRIALTILCAGCFLFASKTNAQDLKLWDNKPAKDWMTDAYPIGNGRIGGMVFGGVAQEHIQFNEISLWTGDEEETGAYQAFGDLYVKFTGKDSTATNYHRELDISKSLLNISYALGAVNYSRQYFCSFPDKVMALHYKASRPVHIRPLYNLPMHIKP
jgi:alpha-L-fucosidase 2